MLAINPETGSAVNVVASGFVLFTRLSDGAVICKLDYFTGDALIYRTYEAACNALACQMINEYTQVIEHKQAIEDICEWEIEEADLYENGMLSMESIELSRDEYTNGELHKD